MCGLLAERSLTEVFKDWVKIHIIALLCQKQKGDRIFYQFNNCEHFPLLDPEGNCVSLTS